MILLHPNSNLEVSIYNLDNFTTKVPSCVTWRMSQASLARLQVTILWNSLGLTSLNMLKKAWAFASLLSSSILSHFYLGFNSPIDLPITSSFNGGPYPYSTAFQILSHCIFKTIPFGPSSGVITPIEKRWTIYRNSRPWLFLIELIGSIKICFFFRKTYSNTNWKMFVQ